MKVAILAGGMGTRLAEETDQRPKPMVEIDRKPILWHVMRYHSAFGMNEFVLALGNKKEIIIRHFVDLYYYSSDLTIKTGDGSVQNSRKAAGTRMARRSYRYGTADRHRRPHQTARTLSR
jgi:glucose-1-phosphate cytidylyltransferase